MHTDMGAPAWATSFDPYGQATATSAPVPTLNDQNPYGYKAGTSGNGNGLTKFGYRWYNAETGAWMQRDTLDAPLDPANGNRYGYAGDDPNNNSDLSGRWVAQLGEDLYDSFNAVNTARQWGNALGSGSSQEIANQAVGATVSTLTALACEGIIVTATGGVGTVPGAIVCSIGGEVVENAVTGSYS